MLYRVIPGFNLPFVENMFLGITTGVKSGSLNFLKFGLSASSAVLHVDAMAMDCPQGTGPDYASGACGQYTPMVNGQGHGMYRTRDWRSRTRDKQCLTLTKICQWIKGPAHRKIY